MISLPRNLLRPREKEVIVEQLIKDVNKGKTGKEGQFLLHFFFVLISKVNKTQGSATFGILLPRNLSRPIQKSSLDNSSRTSSYPSKAREGRSSLLDSSYSAGSVGSLNTSNQVRLTKHSITEARPETQAFKGQRGRNGQQWQ
jgi:hypothetical protein